MFSLLFGFWQYLFRKVEHKVVILGLDSSGKTTVLEQVKYMYLQSPPLPPEKMMPTVGLNVAKVELATSKLTLWDLGGQLALRSIWEKYYEESQALIYVVDVANPQRFDEAKSTLQSLMQHPDLQDVPILFLANKQDILSNAVSTAELRELFLSDSSKDRKIHIQPITALKGDGLAIGINWLEAELLKHAREVTKK